MTWGAGLSADDERAARAFGWSDVATADERRQNVCHLNVRSAAAIQFRGSVSFAIAAASAAQLAAPFG